MLLVVVLRFWIYESYAFWEKFPDGLADFINLKPLWVRHSHFFEIKTRFGPFQLGHDILATKIRVDYFRCSIVDLNGFAP